MTGTPATAPKVPVNLSVKFFNFNIIERCLVLYLDSRYDLILGMAWLERHEPWIDWRSKTLGATRTTFCGALESHEPTSARNQKRYWLEPLADNVSVLDIGMSELVDSDDVKDMRIEQSSICDSEAARTPLSGSRCESNVLNAESVVDQASSHRELNPSDEREVARKYPLCDVGCDSDALNVNIDVVGEILRHTEPGSADAREVARNPRDDDVMSNDSSSDVNSDVSSGLEQVTVDDGIDQRDSNYTSCAISQSDDGYQLYTLVNGVTGACGGTISLEAIPSLSRF